MSQKIQPLLRPIQFAEQQMLAAILEGIYPPGTKLPNERVLAQQLGITRPTLRQVLHCLANEGWLSINHGKTTIVNDYWKTGSMGLLSTIAQHPEKLPASLIQYFLQMRKYLMPNIGKLAAKKAPEKLLSYLETVPQMESSTGHFVRYDWQLHRLMAKLSGNPIYSLLMNDFSTMFTRLARDYFIVSEARELSLNYYQKLKETLESDTVSVKEIVHQAMKESMDLFMSLKT